jgi:hypothetical protein
MGVRRDSSAVSHVLAPVRPVCVFVRRILHVPCVLHVSLASVRCSSMICRGEERDDLCEAAVCSQRFLDQHVWHVQVVGQHCGGCHSFGIPRAVPCLWLLPHLSSHSKPYRHVCVLCRLPDPITFALITVVGISLVLCCVSSRIVVCRGRRVCWFAQFFQQC